MKTYQYRLYPTHKQEKRLGIMLAEATKVWNGLLSKSNEQYKITGKGIISWYDLTMLAKTIETSHLHSHVKQNMSRRLARSYQLFFSKRKAGQYAKPPRFKKEVSSITYPDGYGNGFKVNRNKLSVSKVGNIPIVLHRGFDGNIKTLTIKYNKAGQWYAFFSSDYEDKKAQAPDDEIGIDVGIERFATFSDGTVIENPHFLSKRQHRITRLQQHVSRKKRGSKNRTKAKLLLAKAWQKYDDAKRDFLHKQSTSIASQYRAIAVEDLDITGLLRKGFSRRLHRSIAEASWGEFISLLDQKATMRSGCVKAVPAYNTSKMCSNCGRLVEKALSERTHTCECGVSLHRDLNAAINIARRAGLARTYACGDSTSVAGSIPAASRVVEARTITRQV